MTVIMTCPFCNNIHSVEVDEGAFIQWQEGELIQKAMPNLSTTEREQLISGICPDCQSEMDYWQ